jgi:hypothetical protein
VSSSVSLVTFSRSIAVVFRKERSVGYLRKSGFIQIAEKSHTLPGMGPGTAS